MDNRHFFNIRDLAVIIVLLFIAVTAFIISNISTIGKSEYVQIIYDSQILAELPLDSDTEYIPEFNKNIIIEIKAEKVHFKTSDCPDKICVNTGWLSRPGQTAVCLPNKLSIVLKPALNSDDNIDTEI